MLVFDFSFLKWAPYSENYYGFSELLMLDKRFTFLL